MVILGRHFSPENLVVCLRRKGAGISKYRYVEKVGFSSRAQNFSARMPPFGWPISPLATRMASVARQVPSAESNPLVEIQPILAWGGIHMQVSSFA